MTRNTHPVNELGFKIKWLAAESGTSEKALLGNDRSMVRSGYKKDRVNADFERRLANSHGFDPEWREWRTGTKLEFQTRYREHRFNAARQERRTDIPLAPEPGEQLTGKHRLASLKMTTKLSNSGEYWWIGFELICRAADGIGVKRGYILLQCGEARAEREQWGFCQEYKLPGTDVTIRAGAGTEKKPLWFVAAGSGILDDVIPGEPYCVVTAVGPEDRLFARFSVFLKDYCTQNYIHQEDGEPLTCRKKAVLDRIKQMGLPGGEEGETVLCSHDITFRAAPSISAPETDAPPAGRAVPAKRPGGAR
jgi:hypothetical protein